MPTSRADFGTTMIYELLLHGNLEFIIYLLIIIYFQNVILFIILEFDLL